jgi:putative iron-regulated protein
MSHSPSSRVTPGRKRTLMLWSCALIPLCVNAQEGGEGGEAGGAPVQYQLLLDPNHQPKYDARLLKRHYVELAQKQYGLAKTSAHDLKIAIDALIKTPRTAQLAKAKQAWINARMAYLPTEVFRYYDGPIDRPASTQHPAGPESRINSWPLNEAVIDYVNGQPKTGLVNDLKTPITTQNIIKRDQAADESDVTTGFHAIEFLLWGQDFSATGPGNRPVSDFQKNTAASKRRGAYLQLLATLLERDLANVQGDWDHTVSTSYASEFLALNDFEATGRILRGMAMLAAEELQSERLTVPLDSGAQEDETSCFSDTTHLDFAAGVKGLRMVWQDGTNASLRKLVKSLDAQQARRIDAAMARVTNSAQALEAPFDQMLLSVPESSARKKAEQLATDLLTVASELKQAGLALGVLVSAPGI